MLGDKTRSNIVCWLGHLFWSCLIECERRHTFDQILQKTIYFVHSKKDILNLTYLLSKFVILRSNGFSFSFNVWNKESNNSISFSNTLNKEHSQVFSLDVNYHGKKPPKRRKNRRSDRVTKRRNNDLSQGTWNPDHSIWSPAWINKYWTTNTSLLPASFISKGH